MDKQQAQTLRHLMRCFPKTNQFIQPESPTDDVFVSPGVDYLLERANGSWIFRLLSTAMREVVMGLADEYKIGATKLTIVSRQEADKQYELSIALNEIPENPAAPVLDLDGMPLWQDSMRSAVQPWPEGEWDLVLQVGQGTPSTTNTPTTMLLVHLPGEI